ncbi:MAG: uroporphyrinogen-III synthase [Campylobacterota bacterium]|nr:uroporphyrinogen-III synthase [Campylobacterota bacterium]
MSDKKNIYLLSDKKISGVNSLPIINIDYIKSVTNIKDYDALIFTSKNGVKGIDKFNVDWKNIPSYIIGEQTAKVVNSLDGNIEYIGKNSHGNEFSYELTDKLKGKKVLYIRGEKVASNLFDILIENNITCEELVVYKTKCKQYKDVDLPKGSIIIFSSPSTINCFFKNNLWDDTFKAVVIGKTTARSLPKGITYFISSNTSLESCIEKAREL